MKFITISSRDIDFLRSMFEAASEADRSVHLSWEGDALRVKVGEGIWSAPIGDENQ